MSTQVLVDLTSPSPVPLASDARNLRMALICMPWAGIPLPSIAMGILKQCARQLGCEPDLYYFNVSFARQIGLHLYTSISRQAFIESEWYFAQSLFGPSGTGELDNRWETIKNDAEQRNLIQNLKEAAQNSEEKCQDIAERQVDIFIKSCLEATDWQEYDLVGFTTTFAQSLSSLLLAKHIKEVSPQTKIVFGGANVESEMGFELLSAFDWVDFVVHGEAELSFKQLLLRMAKGPIDQPIPGISMRVDGRVVRGDLSDRPVVNLNEHSPIPDYSDYIQALRDAGLKNKCVVTLFYESSRGCWWGQLHHCTFCGLNGETMAFRKKDASRVYDEIMEISRKYHCFNIVSADNILALDYFKDLLPNLAKAGLDLKLFYEVKANLKKSQVEALAKAGVRKIQPGIESFSSRLLKLMDKGITAIQNIQLLKWCKEYDIAPAWNILYGFPGETRDDYAKLPDLLVRLFHLPAPALMTSVTFERFSPYFFAREKYGLKISPVKAYRAVYPEARVNLARIAYFFEGTWEGQDGDPDEYMRESLQECERWKTFYKESQVYCFYSRGPGYISIFDNRPLTAGSEIKERQFILENENSELYTFCDEHRSLQAIVEMMTERFPGFPEHKINNVLAFLVDRGLMYEENGRYLSLAVRGTPFYSTEKLSAQLT
jgi:ribosomal peptide maturation radical SAM protein 1